MEKRLRINFILHSNRKSGGVLVVLEYARRLRAIGHSVEVYYPAWIPSVYFNEVPAWKKPFSRLASIWRTYRDEMRARAKSASEARLVPFIADGFIRDADVVVATAWPTAYCVAGLAPSKGNKLYLVQGYETWNGRIDEVHASYFLPLGILTISPWLTDLMRAKFGREVVAEIRNGVDLEVFSPPPSKPSEPTILMMYHTQKIKGTKDGLEVLRRVHALHPEARVLMFGLYPFPEKDEFIEYFLDPSIEDLVSLYRKAWIFISPSHSEGWQLPPMEAMACGCAVVATRVGCIPALEAAGNLLSAEPGDIDTLFRHVDVLLREPDQLRNVARKGLDTIQGYGWEEKTREFEQALLVWNELSSGGILPTLVPTLPPSGE